jgi:hypothetical protein
MRAPVIDLRQGRIWTNWHATRGVGGAVERFYTPHNAWTDGSPVANGDFAPGLQALSDIVREAQAQNRRVRALGSGWSLNSVGYVEDSLVNTARLSNWFLGFRTPTLVEPSMRSVASQLVFAQCGTQIKTLNSYLEQAGLALPTSGASNGQTIVGAMSTGTHGSAHDVGSIQDYIRALHLVGEDGAQYWVESLSEPTMTPEFAQRIGAELLRDDELFAAALVSFGSFGLIHGVMFQAVPLPLLELNVAQYDFVDVIDQACTRSVEGLGLPRGDALPFHLEFVFNPYRRGKGEKGAFVRAIYRLPLVGQAPAPVLSPDMPILSQDLVSLAGYLTDVAPAVVPSFLQAQLAGAMPSTTRPILGTPGMIFGDSAPTNGGTSLELGVPLDQVRAALDAIFSVTDTEAFGAPVALRYVKPSKATLAFTRHTPTTCTIEIPGIDSVTAEAAHEKIFTALETKGVPVTYHWGQVSPKGSAALQQGFGKDRVDRWLAARARFLPGSGRSMFSNQFLVDRGLAA